jgi:hypothetical protein
MLLRKQCIVLELLCVSKITSVSKKVHQNFSLIVQSTPSINVVRTKKIVQGKTLNYLLNQWRERLPSIIVDLPTIQGNNPSAIYHFKHCSWYCTYFIQYNKLYQGTLV